MYPEDKFKVWGVISGVTLAFENSYAGGRLGKSIIELRDGWAKGPNMSEGPPEAEKESSQVAVRVSEQGTVQMPQPSVDEPAVGPATEATAESAPEVASDAAPDLTPAPAISAATVTTPNEAADNSPFTPSFDCAKASNGQEKLICADRDLARLDVQAAQAYARARERAIDLDALKKEQLNWIKFSLRACSDKYCLVEAYKKRIAELQ